MDAQQVLKTRFIMMRQTSMRCLCQRGYFYLTTRMRVIQLTHNEIEKHKRSQLCAHAVLVYLINALLILILAHEPETQQLLRGFGGCSILVSSDVPEGKGVSSSAAVEVATMTAALSALGATITPPERIAQLCQRDRPFGDRFGAEDRQVAPILRGAVEGGDQVAVALGRVVAARNEDRLAGRVAARRRHADERQQSGQPEAFREGPDHQARDEGSARARVLPGEGDENLQESGFSRGRRHSIHPIAGSLRQPFLSVWVRFTWQPKACLPSVVAKGGCI